MKKRMRGLTLIELMVTIALAALLLGLAIPNLGNWIRESRLTQGANDIVLAATLARAEALKRRVPVGVCISDLSDATDGDGAACEERGTPVAGDAWIVFVDEDLNLVADTADQILRVMEVPPTSIKTSLAPAHADTDVPYLMFGVDGFRATLPAAASVSVTAAVFCDKRGNVLGVGGNSAARAVMLSPTGRAAVTRGKAEINSIISDHLGGASCKP
jgi:type IV fimbrial biogenesis protein FimT